MKELYQNLGEETPRVMERFSKKLFKPDDLNLSEEKYEAFFKRNKEKFYEALSRLLDLWDTEEHRETLGHDNIHISYDLIEFLYLSRNVDLRESERYITLFGSLIHDLGRYPELLLKERSGAMNFDKPSAIQFHAALSGYLGALFSREFAVESAEQDTAETSKAFDRRVIGAALFHGGKNDLRDPVILNVQTIDRLAGILGSREFVRNVVTDGVQRGAAVYPDERLQYDRSFPLFNNLPVDKYAGASEPKKSWTNILHYLEMPMRNIFPLANDFSTQRAKAMRRESGVILTLMSGGKGSKLFKQIFAPELNGDGEYSFPKTKLPDDIWEQINSGMSAEEEAEIRKISGLDLDELIDMMLDQQAYNINGEDREKVHKLFNEVGEIHKEDVRRTLRYVVARRNLNKKIEKDFLLEVAGDSKNELEALIANRLIKTKLFE